MAFSSSSIIDYAEIKFGVNGLEEVHCQNTDGDYFVWDFADGYPAENSQAETDLEFIQGIYSTNSNRFLDSDDNVVEIGIDNLALDIEANELESHGWFNPFVDGSYGRYIESLEFRSLPTLDQVRIKGEDNEKRLESKIGQVVVPVQATGSTHDYSLNELDIVKRSDDIFSIYISIDSHDDVDSISDIEALPLTKAFLSWLESLRYEGTALNTGSIADTNFNSRKFRIRQTTGADYLQFEYRNSDSYRVGTIYRHYTFHFDVLTDSPASLDISDLSATVHESTGSISTTGLMLPPPSGHLDVPFQGRVWDAGSNRKIKVRNQGVHFRGFSEVTQRPFEVPIMGGAGLAYFSSALNDDNNGRRIINGDEFVNGVIFDGTADGSVIFPKPTELMLYSYGFNRNMTVYNDTDNECEVFDWNDDFMTVVPPNDNAIFNLRVNKSDAPEIIGVKIPLRRMSHIGDQEDYGTVATLGNFREDNGNELWTIGPHHTTVNPSQIQTHVDADAFTIFTNPINDGLPSNAEIDRIDVDWENYIDPDINNGPFEFNGVWEHRFAGYCKIDFSCGVTLRTSTGSLPEWHGLRLLLIRGDDIRRFEALRLYENLSGNDAKEKYELNWEGDYEAGDKFCLLFRARNPSIDMLQVDYTFMDREVTIQQEIKREYTG